MTSGLLQRWLFQYLCEQKLVNNRPPNGFKVSVSSTISCPVNGKTVLSPVRRNGLAKIIGELRYVLLICVHLNGCIVGRFER